MIGHEPRRQNKPVPSLASRMPLRLDMKPAGAKVRGTFAGAWPKPKSITTPADVQGTVAGVRRDQKSLRAANGLRPDASWPSWLRPNQNFSSGPCDRPLVADPADARLLWASRYVGPPEGGSHRYGACAGTPPAAGGASPLVWRGKVYQFRLEPAGAVYQKHLDTILAGPRGEQTRRRMQAIGWTLTDMRRRWAIDADEQLVCMDAATGRTLWTVTWPSEGLAVFSHKCGLTNHTGAVAEVDGKGRVFVFGALGIVRCVAAETGDVLWATPVRFDEGHVLALPGVFVLHPDTQHGSTKMFLLPAKAGAKAGAIWLPPHPHATTYQAPMSHAWADGRLFIRGGDAVYCYDLRR